MYGSRDRPSPLPFSIYTPGNSMTFLPLFFNEKFWKIHILFGLKYSTMIHLHKNMIFLTQPLIATWKPINMFGHFNKRVRCKNRVKGKWVEIDSSKHYLIHKWPKHYLFVIVYFRAKMMYGKVWSLSGLSLNILIKPGFKYIIIQFLIEVCLCF